MRKPTMTPRQRVMTALRGGCPDRTPFIYPLRPSTIERELRNRGMCMEGHVPSYEYYPKNVDIKSVYYEEATDIMHKKGKLVGNHLDDELTDPENLWAELDTYWVQHGGADPVEWGASHREG